METIVDVDVRRTWEIDAKDLVLKDGKWTHALNKFLGEAAGAMELGGRITARPYKLLIYEPGGFFADHQDSEKAPGMFGTLLIGLPSQHGGGEILLDTGGEDRLTVDFSTDNAKDFPAVAFVADRHHEIRPVTEGYRVVLVYNLFHAAWPAC